MSLITETNRQYYEGTKSIVAIAGQTIFDFSGFDTPFIWKTSDGDNDNYELNNFKFYKSVDNGVTFTEVVYYTTPTSPRIISVKDGVITLNSGASSGNIYLVQLKRLEGGKYGDNNAFGTVVEENYGSWTYIKLYDVVNNFMTAYVGTDKIISDIKRTDVIFHAKRGLQEFSYDVLKSIKSQELTIPPSLNVVIPQDYVNYVKISRIDEGGVKHIIYPGMLSGTPYTTPIQDTEGIPVQDTFDQNISGTSIIEERWSTNHSNELKSNEEYFTSDLYNNNNISRKLGQRYGMDTANANINGVFMVNDREGKISFSSDLVGSIILLEYISDGLAYDLDTRVPKLAEEAMYAYIMHSVISNRLNQPEYLVQRLKQEKFAKIRNAKIRLSNIKLEEFTKVLRGQYKWIKH
jgi:hypothetical protein